MNIDDILKKCTEIPGITIQHKEFSTELILKQSGGNGSMTFFPLFPGLVLAYIFVNSPTWPAPDLCSNASNAKGPLLLNYCVSGRCEMALNSGNFVYVKEGEISLTERFARKQYVYPLRIYEGMEIFIDTDTLMAKNPWLQNHFSINFRQLTSMYCPNGSTYIRAAAKETQAIVKQLWELFDLPVPFAILQMKIYTLALLSILQNIKEIPPSQARTFFTETQVDIAKRIEKIITADLRQHHPAREFSEKFAVSETSLKNYFRGVFGQNISVYIREIRMKAAAKLLISTKLSVAEIAEQVGYMNQSKFAAVFKKQFEMSPLEYRRSRHLETQP